MVDIVLTDRRPEADPPCVVVVMGVSGAGKSTVAAAIARALDLPLIDADALHSAANRRKMRSGVPLTDEDRWPWLDEVSQSALRQARGPGVIVACSALRRAYRDRLALPGGRLFFVWLDPGEDELARRLAHRTGHFMPPDLLRSQLDTLEALGRDEPGCRLDDTGDLTDTVARATELLCSVLFGIGPEESGTPDITQ